jgi:hypothetical protein
MRELKKDLWPIRVSIKSPEVGFYLRAETIEEWLGHNVGKFKDTWNVTYNGPIVDYYFQDDVTATLFSLRWT